MSYTEFHKGIFQIVARGDEAIKKYIKDNNLEERIDLSIDEDTEEICYLEDCEDYNGDKYDQEYHMITYQRYMKDVDKNIDPLKRYDHNPNAEHVLIKYIEYQHLDLDEADINFHDRLSKDEFSFAVSFYNGGATEIDAYENIINKYNLNEDYEQESQNVKITPRESYMILDCFQYVLYKMNEEQIDYLFCNYSKEEIAKFGQKFGDMNLKNGW